MNTVINETKIEYEIKKSRFICYLSKVTSVEEANEYLNDVKQRHLDARHVVFAYIIDDYEKLSDDGEPKGTAGKPIYNILKNHNLNFVICIVVRYFGGIKLGAGGLIRAYGNSLKANLDKTDIFKLNLGNAILLTFPYSYIKSIDYYLKENNYCITDKKFNKEVEYTIDVLKSDIKDFKTNILNINYTIRIEILNEKNIVGEKYEKDIIDQ